MIDNGIGGYLFDSYNILFCTVFALYFFNDCIAHTATAQKGVRNSGDRICDHVAELSTL